MYITKFFTSFPSYIFYIVLLLIFGVVAFNKTFHLSLFGDEWMMLWVIKNSVVTTGHWNTYINQTITPRLQITALISYLLTEYFGSDGKAIYIFSFITRFLASLTLFYFLRKRECSNIAAFLGSLLFLITPIGLQATDWVENFTSYISIVFFLLCIDSIYTLKSWKNVLIFLLTFSLSIYVNPIRAHGIILAIPFLLISQYFFSRVVSRKSIIFSLLCSLVLIFILSKIYYVVYINFPPLPIETFLGAIGTTLLPQQSYAYFGLLIAALLLWKKYLLSKRYLPFTLALHILFFAVSYGPLYQIAKDKMFIIIGVYFLLFMISAFIIELLNKKALEALNTSMQFLLNICFLIAPLLVGTLIIDPTHRYLIYSALSLPIILAFSFNQNIPIIKLKTISFCVTLLFLVIFYQSLKSEIDRMYVGHNQDTTNIIWQQIAPFFENYDFKNHRALVFIATDNGAIVHDAVTFGFGYHMGYIYKIWISDINEVNNRLPVVVDSLTDFTSLITDGKVARKYLGKDSDFVFPKTESFYFKIDGLKVTIINDY